MPVNKNDSSLSIGSKRKADTAIDASPNGEPPAKQVKEDESDEEPEDGIRFWEAGWKDRYYQAKFQVSESDQEFRRKVACAYLEGIAWMFHYYRKVILIIFN
jgi:5'-3' exoribonuclease 2